VLAPRDARMIRQTCISLPLGISCVHQQPKDACDHCCVRQRAGLRTLQPVMGPAAPKADSSDCTVTAGCRRRTIRTRRTRSSTLQTGEQIRAVMRRQGATENSRARAGSVPRPGLRRRHDAMLDTATALFMRHIHCIKPFQSAEATMQRPGPPHRVRMCPTPAREAPTAGGRPTSHLQSQLPCSSSRIFPLPRPQAALQSSTGA
jgi:hypothetical protein